MSLGSKSNHLYCLKVFIRVEISPIEWLQELHQRLVRCSRSCRSILDADIQVIRFVEALVRFLSFS
jgi:hypothetical protein